MNLNITGHHLEVSPAIHSYVTDKLERIVRHCDNIIDIRVVVGTQKQSQKAEVSLHLKGRNIHVDSESTDLYAAIDLVMDKLDRQVNKYKERIKDHRAIT